MPGLARKGTCGTTPAKRPLEDIRPPDRPRPRPVPAEMDPEAMAMDVDEDADAAGRLPEPVDRVAPTTPEDLLAPPPDRPAVVDVVDPGVAIALDFSGASATTSCQRNGHDANFVFVLLNNCFSVVFSVPEREKFLISPERKYVH